MMRKKEKVITMTVTLILAVILICIKVTHFVIIERPLKQCRIVSAYHLTVDTNGAQIDQSWLFEKDDLTYIRIGQLKLGMTSDELENALLQMKKQWSNSSDEAMQMECCAETDDPNLITGRYMDNDSFFLVQYRNGKATEIGIQRDLSKVASIKLFGIDMFNTTAECIIDSLMKKDNVICNEKDLQLGTEYLFPEIGVRLWRERAFHLKLLKDPLYIEEMQAVLEDEYQYQYFQMVTVMG